MAPQTAAELPQSPAERITRYCTWEQYVSVREATDELRLQLTYLDGVLEIMAPHSELHEESKVLIGRLLETWAVERRVDLRGFGNTTWRAEAKAAGTEGDEAYKLGPLQPGAVPDLVIEVVVTSAPSENKLRAYARLGVREIWQWWPRSQRLLVLQLVHDSYEEHVASALLPELDLGTLAAFATRLGQSQTDVILAYRATL